MADERKAFLLRADPSLWKEIESWASDELRSVNGQIELPGKVSTTPAPSAIVASSRSEARSRILLDHHR